MSCVIGIDSGGTHIVGQAIRVDGQVIGKYDISGTGNIVVDYDGTMRRITGLINKIDKQFSLKSCKKIVIGIAGFETSSQAEKFQQELSDQFNVPMIFMTDVALGLWNVLAGKDGILALSGTGSVIFAKFGDSIDRVGGWGYLLGDEGSAYDITRRTLKILAADVDKKVNSDFVSAYLHLVKKNKFRDLVSKIYSSNRKEIASLALVTVKLADKYPEAKEVIKQSAISLADQTVLMLKRYPDKTLLIGESGSVLLNNNYYRKIFEDTVKSFKADAEFVTTKRNNSYGAYYYYKNKENL